MAKDRGEKEERFEHYSRRLDAQRDRRNRGHDDAGSYEPDYDDLREGRAWDRHDWRERDDHDAAFERGRDADYDTVRRRPLAAEHRARFLRRGTNEAHSGGYGDERGRETWNDYRSGPYAGRGPKGYQRSDERILEDVCERLTDHPSIDASEIEVTVRDGDVSLAGLVESRAVKHLTEAMVETVSGVKEVHNQLRVAAAVGGDWPRSSVERAPNAVGPKHRR